LSEENNCNSLPLIGDKFPNINVKTTQGNFVLPKHFAGRWFVLFSHPADFTPVCTTEFLAFQKRYKDFKKLNCELIGLSIDQVFSHLKWLEWIKDKFDVKIEFPVIADDTTIAKKLGMIHPNKGNNTVRSVFIVDSKGILRLILYYPQEVGRNIDEILRAVDALKIADGSKVAIPANWPNNEVINGNVIIPPAADEKTKEQRIKDANKNKIKSYDWWFCYKKL